MVVLEMLKPGGKVLWRRSLFKSAVLEPPQNTLKFDCETYCLTANNENVLGVYE